LTYENEALRKDFALTDQIRKAALSSMSNVAEGFARFSDKEFANFLNSARASVGCFQCCLFIGRRGKSAAHQFYEISAKMSVP
jgi:four helix bundle protein